VRKQPVAEFNFTSTTDRQCVKGPYGWNQAIKSDVDVYKVFSVSDDHGKTFA
jgi:hypothetical protein